MINQYPGLPPEILCHITEYTASITINRPERKNAINGKMWEALADLFDRLKTDPEIRVIIIRGEGGNFSAGADISEFDDMRGDSDTARAYELANSRAFAAIRDAGVPVIAVIRGICFGGGFGIAAACDLRIAASDAQFSVPAAKLGLAYPQDAMIDIVRSCGTQTAKFLTFTGSRMDSGRALEAGFLLAIHDATHLEEECKILASRIAGNAPLSVRASKVAIDAASLDDESRKKMAIELGAMTFDSADYAEGRAAFREKRQPLFSGT